MSIINEALKKSQNRREALKKDFKPNTPFHIKGYRRTRGYKFSRFAAIIAIVVLALVPFYLLIVYGPAAYNPPKDISPQQPASESGRTEDAGLNTESSAGAIPYIPPIINTRRSERSEQQIFKLSGIVFGSGQPFAVINDKVLVVGDFIEGGEIINIEKNRVTLLFEDEEIALTLK